MSRANILSIIKNISDNPEYDNVKASYKKLEEKIENIDTETSDQEVSNIDNINSINEAIEYIKNKLINNEDTN